VTVELPADPAPNGVEVTLIDFGMVLRPATGAAVQRINRAGSRFRVAVSYPPMTPAVAAAFVARWQRAKREGLKIEYPLLGHSQSGAGAPVVDGANPTGTTLPIRGLTPGYAVREGWPLTLVDADEQGYLHFAASAGKADASGDLEIEVEPPIRAPLADGSEIRLAAPTVEGVVVDDIAWLLNVDRLVRGGGIVIEEAA
jgi:hypothetical protein